jgi:hypothetical protein
MSQYLNLATQIQPMVLYSGQLSATTETTIYTGPASSNTCIKQAVICNTDTASVNVSVSVLQNGQATGTTEHRIISEYPLAAGDSLPLNDYLDNLYLGPGDFITVTASTANVVNVMLSGILSQ